MRMSRGSCSENGRATSPDRTALAEIQTRLCRTREKTIVKNSNSIPPGFVVWITGLPNSGKTTVAAVVQSELRARGLSTVGLDGDNLRRLFSNRWGFSKDERIELATAYSRLAEHLSLQGLIVIVSVVAMFDSVYRRNRDTIGNYIEVFLDVPYDERVRRDKATAKNVYSSPSYSENIYDPPQAADLCLENFGANDSARVAAKIVALLEERMAETERSPVRLRRLSP
jgi:cytidine diphosphoramidate kinase